MPKFSPVIIAQFGPPALAAIRSWGRRGARVGMIQILSEGEPVPRSRYLAEHIAMTAEEFLSGEGLERVAAFLHKFGADLLLTINEQLACHLDENRHLLDNNIRFLFSGSEVTRAVFSKSGQLDVARRLGMKLLPTWEIDSADYDLSLIPPNHYPLCLRPARPGEVLPSFKVKIVRTPAELEGFVRSIKQFGSPVLAQPFTNVPNLVVHGVRGLDGRSCGVEGFLVARKFEGVTLTIRSFDISDDLRQQCVAFVEDFDVVGPWHFEFLYDPVSGVPWFLELNSRLGGTTAKVLACGYDEPAWTLKSFGVDISPGSVRKGVTASSKKALGKFLLRACKGQLTPLDYPDEPRWRRVVMALYGLAVWRDDVFAWDDLPGTLTLYGLPSMAKLRVWSRGETTSVSARG